MHPNRYPNDASRVGLVAKLIIGVTALAWFAPHGTPILENFEAFINKFQASFPHSDTVKTVTNKIQRLCQGDRPMSTYATNFRLLVCDIPWDEVAEMDLSNILEALLVH
jgi:hypothetical protein